MRGRSLCEADRTRMRHQRYARSMSSQCRQNRTSADRELLPPDQGRLASALPVKRCQMQITHPVGSFVLNEEAAIMKCPVSQYFPLDAYEQPFQLVWAINGSENINTADESRIQTDQYALWILPAVMEDSGIYTCIVRNSSFCIEISMSLTVVSEADLSDIEYEQIAFENGNFQMNCPDIREFESNFGDMKLKWYKNGEDLAEENSRFQYLDGTTYALINDVRHDDAGYYKCQFDFTHENTDFSVSRIIHLRTIGQERRQHPVIVQPSRKTIAAAIGSKLVIPCKVFTGPDERSLMVWWQANHSFIDDYSADGRVVEGKLQKTMDADGQYFEVPLIFEQIEEQDFRTDFRCIARNDHGHEVLPTQIRQAASSFAWYFAAAPAFVVLLIVAIILVHKHRKSGNKKDYSMTKL
ncbi:PREDICTED: interleukin-1 receptor type 2 [Nanorana parkeri]|uniref:interleukin-1 receptor type 2 n=1 Tax=Nanorana parkeri TaxID=125878 RepID=UPI000853F0A4|nr:PREDICTED: interleukin-1 receptor type 2 [Nanorana parkeri]